jgi:hypothetical protein
VKTADPERTPYSLGYTDGFNGFDYDTSEWSDELDVDAYTDGYKNGHLDLLNSVPDKNLRNGDDEDGAQNSAAWPYPKRK